MLQKLSIRIFLILTIGTCCINCLWIQHLDDSDDYYRITFEDEILAGESLIRSRGPRSLYRGYQGMETDDDMALDEFYEFGDDHFVTDYDYDF